MVATADDIPRELLKDGRSLLQYPVQDDSARVLCLRAEQNSGRLRAALGIPNLCSTPGGVVEGRTARIEQRRNSRARTDRSRARGVLNAWRRR